jgi:hypothetical protein
LKKRKGTGRRSTLTHAKMVLPQSMPIFLYMGQNEEREGPCRHRSDKGVGGDGTGTVAGEGVNEVLEGGLEGGGEANTRLERRRRWMARRAWNMFGGGPYEYGV